MRSSAWKWFVASASVATLIACSGLDSRDVALSSAGAAPVAGSGGPLGSGGVAGASAMPGTEGNGASGSEGVVPAAIDPGDGSAASTMPDPAAAGAAGAAAALPSQLSANALFHDFGLGEVAVASEAFDWVITNSGQAPTAALALTNASSGLFSLTTTCSGALAPGASCSLSVRFTPTALGTFSDVIRIGDGSQQLSLDVSGLGRYRLTLARVGRGEISVIGGTLACQADTCTGLFEASNITLQARTQNGSGSFFANWSIGDCRSNQLCSIQMTEPRSITARFMELRNNLAFNSSAEYAPNLGGLAAYDAECNRLATTAGVNDAAGSAFIAAMSDGNTSLRTRLGNARGWVRLDGFPVADTAAELFDRGMLYSVTTDERGALLPGPDRARGSFDSLTGTLADGSSAPGHCNNWTSTSADVALQIGRTSGGPTNWLEAFESTCGVSVYNLVCMGRRSTAPIADFQPYDSFPTTTKLMWATTSTYTPADMTPDQKCQAERPANAARAVAYLAYTNRPASAVLLPNVTYVRPDGAVVGTAEDLTRMAPFAAPWVRADGSVDETFPFDLVFTGAESPSDLAIEAENCLDWRGSTDDTIRGVTGDYGHGSARFFYTGARTSCSSPARLYCVEP